MIQQLRIYEIFEENKTAFHARFREHAMRIMSRYGFTIVATWESSSPQGTRFIYVLDWPDLATKESAWRAFLADEEWKDIKRVTSERHGELVGQFQDYVLLPTPYSPAPIVRGAVRP